MCDGPLIWYPCEGGAILHCAGCDHLTVGNFDEAAHMKAPLVGGAA